MDVQNTDAGVYTCEGTKNRFENFLARSVLKIKSKIKSVMYLYIIYYTINSNRCRNDVAQSYESIFR